MSKPRVYYLQRVKQKPSKPYLLLLGVNIHRELISYLTLPEFIDFCLICNKLLKFIRDPYVLHKIPINNLPTKSETEITEALMEEKLAILLYRQIYPSVNLE